MTSERLQQHFDQYPVTRIGSGGSMVVYGTDKAVLKVAEYRPPPPSLGMVPTGTITLNLDLFSKIVEKTRDTAERGLKMLGGLVVPYELPDAINARVCESVPRFACLPLLARKTVEHPRIFSRPIVQQRVPSHTILARRLETAASGEDFDAIAALIGQLIDLNVHLLRSGAYPHDPLPDNYAVLDDGMLAIYDLGALTLNRRPFRNFMKRGKSGAVDLASRRKNNLWIYQKTLSAAAQHPRVISSLRSLSAHFLQLETLQYVDAVFAKDTRQATPVPGVSL